MFNGPVLPVFVIVVLTISSRRLQITMKDVLSSIRSDGCEIESKTFKDYESSVCANDWILAQAVAARDISALDGDEHGLLGHHVRSIHE